MVTPMVLSYPIVGQFVLAGLMPGREGMDIVEVSA